MAPHSWQIKPLTAEQVLAFLKAAESDRLEALFVMAVTTGLRQGELFALRWADVDLEKAIVVVKATLLEINGKLMLGPPKSDSSRRRVGLPKLALDALHEHRKRMMAEGFASSEWVFCDQKGGWLRRTNMISRNFKPVLKAAGLPESVRFHDLRHTAFTLLASQNVHPKVVQSQAGHASISETMDTYSHFWPHIENEAAAKMDAALTPVEAATA